MTLWPQGQCMPSSCHGRYVYRLWGWQPNPFPFSVHTNRQTDATERPTHAGGYISGMGNKIRDYYSLANRLLIRTFRCVCSKNMARNCPKHCQITMHSILLHEINVNVNDAHFDRKWKYYHFPICIMRKIVKNTTKRISSDKMSYQWQYWQNVKSPKFQTLPNFLEL